MIRIALAQKDFPVGDLRGNLDRALNSLDEARDEGVQLLVFPELALTGYPPEDLLLRAGFLRQAAGCLDKLVAAVSGIDVVIGHPWQEQGRLFNALSWIRSGRVIGRYLKHQLPNYAVFDEQRYFVAGNDSLVMALGDCRIGVLICEDSWVPGPVAQARAAGAELLLIANASPYRDDQLDARAEMMAARFSESGIPMVYCNLVGGQDELVFDGRSMLYDHRGPASMLGPLCADSQLLVEFDAGSALLTPGTGWVSAKISKIGEIYRVLVRGLSDYVHKNGFGHVVLGLSGGVDSALTLALCVDALGADRVHAVMMPSKFTSRLSLNMAREQARALGVDYHIIEINAGLETLERELTMSLGGPPEGLTHENLQARIRGQMIMALSNQFGWLPIATSNKSEMAVGYSTLYGDMCGGFAPLKDCLKTRVYQLAEYRNLTREVIPKAVIERPPSAELRPEQTDQDSLPPYDELDAILHRYVDRDRSVAEIVGDGFEEATVRRVAAMVLNNEYKRRQAPPGVRVTSRGFGRDRRYPITSGWRENPND